MHGFFVYDVSRGIPARTLRLVVVKVCLILGNKYYANCSDQIHCFIHLRNFKCRMRYTRKVGQGSTAGKNCGQRHAGLDLEAGLQWEDRRLR